MGRINHYDVYVSRIRDNVPAPVLAEKYDTMPTTIHAVAHQEAWNRRHLEDRFAKTVCDKMTEFYEEEYGLDYRNGASKLYRALCHHFGLSSECVDDDKLLLCVSELDKEKIMRIPGISEGFARVLYRMIDDVKEGRFDD